MNKPLKLYWWNRVPNFGDTISRTISEFASGRAVTWAPADECDLFSIGSIMRHARQGIRNRKMPGKVHIWGTGCMGPMRFDFISHAEFAMVRGPHTAQILKLDMNSFGDPGLLIANALPDSINKSEKIGIVPHMSQIGNPIFKELVTRYPEITIINPKELDALNVVRQISQCRFIISSSLHGLIVADSYEIPNCWLDPTGIHKDFEFKFQDYAASIDRNLGPPLLFGDIENFILLLRKATPEINYIAGINRSKEQLLNSFPQELRNNQRRNIDLLTNSGLMSKSEPENMPMADTEFGHPKNAQNEACVLVCCMRNEGPFIVEWVAYHSLLGFSNIVVFSNDCTDGSDILLDQLDLLGYITHVRHSPEKGENPQNRAMEIALSMDLIQKSDWMMHIDADEFLQISAGSGKIDAILATSGDAHIIIFLWKLFGDSGLTDWRGGHVISKFQRAQNGPMRRTANHKSMFRVGIFNRMTDHMPKESIYDQVVVKDTAGKMVSDAMVHHPRKSRYKCKFHELTFENAALNHYATKSSDIWLMKNDRGDGQGNVHSNYFLNSKLYKKYNRNEIEDTLILSKLSDLELVESKMRSNETLRKLELKVIDAFDKRRTKVLTPAQIEIWTAQV